MTVTAEIDTWPDYADHVAALAVDVPELAKEVAPFRGLADLLAWMSQRKLTQTSVDMVGQDEFNYDFLIQIEPGGRWIAFGVT